MSSDNPFEVSPDGYGDRSGHDRGVVTAEVSTQTIELLNQTRPWVLLIGILLWIATVIVGVFSVIAIIGAILDQRADTLIIGVIYVIAVLIYALMARSLTRYAGSISRLNMSERIVDLEEAIAAQKTFWKIMGIITLINLIIVLLVVLLAFAGATFFMRLIQQL